MSKIIGVTVGTPIGVEKLKEKLKPVTSVNNVKPDKNGNVDVSAGGGGGGVYVGSGEMPDGYNVQIDPEGEVIDLDALIEEKIGDFAGSQSYSTVVTLASSGWAKQANGRYSQTVVVEFMTADAPVVHSDVCLPGEDVAADDLMEEAYVGNVYRMEQGGGSVTFWAKSKPDVNIQVSVGVS